MTFGFYRVEIIGALASVLLILMLAVILFYSATIRILHPPAEINSDFMLYTSLFGLCCNIASALVLKIDDKEEEPKEAEKSKTGNVELINKKVEEEKSNENNKEEPKKKKTTQKNVNFELNNHLELPEKAKSVALTNASAMTASENANVKATYIHILGDIIQSVGVVIGSIIIKCQPTWIIVDPIITYIFAFIVGTTTIGVIKDCMKVLLERVPEEIDIEELRGDLLRVDGAKSLHQLHVWSLTDGKPVLMCHVKVADGHQSKTVLKDLTIVCRRWGIYHTTLQVEDMDN